MEKFGLQWDKPEYLVLAKHYRKGKIFGDEKFPGKLIFGEKFELQWDKLENLILAKHYREGKTFGDEKFLGKLIFAGKIWAAKG